jgi:2'-hydroxyisoflavone reductase
MRVLVLGGSWFVGAGVVRAAVARGDEVWVFNRGVTPAVFPARVEVVHGDRTRGEDLAALARHGPWDVVVDVAGAVPAQVRDAALALSPVCSRWVFVSSVSAYTGWPDEAVDETSAVYAADPDADGAPEGVCGPVAYGMLKAGCEAAARREFGPERTIVLRPSVVLGPGEYVGRLPWWLDRARRGGRILAPGRPDQVIQPVDVDDLAAFALWAGENAPGGVYDVAMPEGCATFGSLLRTCLEVTGSTGVLEWVDEEWLQRQPVRQWTEIPLWRPQPGTWAVGTRRAQAQGLVCRPVEDTVARVWDWLSSGGRPVPHPRWRDHGLDPAKEHRLLAAWDALAGA